jgi:hypothetical protein
LLENCTIHLTTDGLERGLLEDGGDSIPNFAHNDPRTTSFGIETLIAFAELRFAGTW